MQRALIASLWRYKTSTASLSLQPRSTLIRLHLSSRQLPKKSKMKWISRSQILSARFSSIRRPSQSWPTSCKVCKAPLKSGMAKSAASTKKWIDCKSLARSWRPRLTSRKNTLTISRIKWRICSRFQAWWVQKMIPTKISDFSWKKSTHSSLSQTKGWRKGCIRKNSEVNKSSKNLKRKSWSTSRYRNKSCKMEKKQNERLTIEPLER